MLPEVFHVFLDCEGIMCGFLGIVTQSNQALGPILLDAGERLSYGGYDSVGCVTISEDGEFDLRKDVGKIGDISRRLRFSEMQGQRGIIQLRWATFGAPSTLNAQPHLDSDGELVGAHIGNVVNNVELRKEFIAEGMTVRSTNDGESCVHAVERYVRRGCSLEEACRFAYRDLAGDYVFIIGQRNTPGFCAVKKGSSLVVGFTPEAALVSTDLTCILPLTRKILFIQDGEVVSIFSDRVEIRNIQDGSLINREPEMILESVETAQKGGFDHFMLKEIHEQPQVAGELIHFLEDSPNVLPMVECMQNARTLYLVGSGSSYNACLLGSLYLSWVAAQPSIPVAAQQFAAHYGPCLKSGDVAVFVSQSGETRDVIAAEEVARQRGVRTLGLVNRIGSSLTRACERYLPIASGYEISIPATKTFLNQSIAFLYLALQMGDVPAAGLRRLPELLEQTLEMTNLPIQKLAHEMANLDEMYCLGLGGTYPIALEGALKIKQTSYTHCEGLPASEFKYGALSAVRSDYPVLFVAGPEDAPRLISGLNEVHCRGGRAIVISEKNPQIEANAQEIILLPTAGALFNPLLAVIPLQFLAYNLALEHHTDPDAPRNLTKTLTVD